LAKSLTQESCADPYVRARNRVFNAILARIWAERLLNSKEMGVSLYVTARLHLNSGFRFQVVFRFRFQVLRQISGISGSYFWPAARRRQSKFSLHLANFRLKLRWCHLRRASFLPLQMLVMNRSLPLQGPTFEYGPNIIGCRQRKLYSSIANKFGLSENFRFQVSGDFRVQVSGFQKSIQVQPCFTV
jgi:hypothetical protein